MQVVRQHFPGIYRKFPGGIKKTVIDMKKTMNKIMQQMLNRKSFGGSFLSTGRAKFTVDNGIAILAGLFHGGDLSEFWVD